MTISFTCPSCKKTLKAADDKAGAKLACPSCRQGVIVPKPGLLQRAEQKVKAVGKTAQTVQKAAKSVGDAADAVTDATEKVKKAVTTVAGLSAGGSTLAGSVGDFLRPLGNINIVVFVLALASAGVLFLLGRRKQLPKVRLKLKLGTVASLAVALIFGLWAGAGAVGGKGDRGVLASNIPAVERAQAAVVPTHQPPAVAQPAEPKEEPVGEVCRFSVPAAVWSWTAFSPDGHRLLYCGLSPSTKDQPRNENWLIEWEWESGKELRRVALPARAYQNASFSPDRRWLLLSAFRDAGDDLLWDVEAGRVARPLERPGGSFCRAAFCPDGEFAVVCGGDAIGVVDARTGKVVRRFAGADVTGTCRLAVSPDGKLAYTTASRRPCRLWDVATGKFLREVGRPQLNLGRPAFTPDSRLVLDGGKGDVRLWDVRTGKDAGSFDGLDQFLCAAFSPDGRLLLTADFQLGEAGGLRVWDVAGWKEVARLSGHTGHGPEGIDISPDGRFAASSSQDGTVRVWRLPRPQNDKTRVVMRTSLGDIDIELERDKAPRTVTSFLAYVDQGFYDGTIIDTVENRPDARLIMGGAFTPGRKVREPTLREDDIDPPNDLPRSPGTVVMRSPTRPGLAPTQFIINVSDNTEGYRKALGNKGRSVVFGRVVGGMDVVNRIAAVTTSKAVPVEDVMILSIRRR